jgi:hypothetical protein
METVWAVTYDHNASMFELRSGDTVHETRVTPNAMVAELMDRGLTRENAAALVFPVAREAGIYV